MMVFGDIILFAAGYTASIYTWQWLRTKFTGIQTEVASLEARAAALKAALTVK